jgi:hypothetical protein
MSGESRLLCRVEIRRVEGRWEVICMIQGRSCKKILKALRCAVNGFTGLEFERDVNIWPLGDFFFSSQKLQNCMVVSLEYVADV